jgi:hypothetical protein
MYIQGCERDGKEIIKYSHKWKARSYILFISSSKWMTEKDSKILLSSEISSSLNIFVVSSRSLVLFYSLCFCALLYGEFCVSPVLTYHDVHKLHGAGHLLRN